MCVCGDRESGANDEPRVDGLTPGSCARLRCVNKSLSVNNTHSRRLTRPSHGLGGSRSSFRLPTVLTALVTNAAVEVEEAEPAGTRSSAGPRDATTTKMLKMVEMVMTPANIPGVDSCYAAADLTQCYYFFPPSLLPAPLQSQQGEKIKRGGVGGDVGA